MSELEELAQFLHKDQRIDLKVKGAIFIFIFKQKN